MNFSASKTKKKLSTKTPGTGQKNLSSFFTYAKSRSCGSTEENLSIDDSSPLNSGELISTPKQDVDKKRKRNESDGKKSPEEPRTKKTFTAKTETSDIECLSGAEGQKYRGNDDRRRNILSNRCENQENNYKLNVEKKKLFTGRNSLNEIFTERSDSDNCHQDLLPVGEVKDDFTLIKNVSKVTQNILKNIEEETMSRKILTQSKTNRIITNVVEKKSSPEINLCKAKSAELSPKLKVLKSESRHVFKELSPLLNKISPMKREENHDILQEFFMSDNELDIDENEFKCNKEKDGYNPIEASGNSVTKFEQSDSVLTDDFDDIFNDEWNGDPEVDVDLNTLQRCRVSEISRDKFQNIILRVKHVKTEVSVTVKLMGFWKDTRIQLDDIISIQASKQSNGWVVDNNSGFVVEQPDFLVSGTSVVGALFCQRRGVLSDRFKGVETVVDCQQGSSVMVIGSLLHEMVQEVLKQKIYTKRGIEKLLNDILTTQNTSQMLYSAGISLETCKKEMYAFIPKVYNFVERYLKGKLPKPADGNFSGIINVVKDIEENLWVPQLGVKGKVDVTVEVNINSRRRIMPLELKTGRASFSLEHRGQVILYTMMMAVTGQEVDTGLLLYLRENIMRELKVGHPEKRDLILLRNNLAYHLTRGPQITDRSDSGLEMESQIDSLELPEPINHRACQNCPYSALCCTYLKNDRNFQPNAQHPLIPIMQRLDEYLKPEHIDYVKKWVKMLQIEEADQLKCQSYKDMWTIPPLQRENNGKCISNLKVSGKVIEESGRYRHTFVRVDPNGKKDLLKCGISAMEYVIVSTNTKINLCAGPAIEISKDSITLLLERNLAEKRPNDVFHIDVYSSQSIVIINFSNIGYLLEDNTVTEKMRKIVIEKEPAKFFNKLDRSVAGAAAEILKTLNKMQQRAVIKIIAAKDYLLIKGMPGSGKTKTLVAAIELLVKLGKSVLLTAHTHSAVDNVLLKLIKTGVDFLRLGTSSRIHPSLLSKSESVLTKDCLTPESLEAAYNSKNVVCVTCLGANHPLLRRRVFDVCLVDESTQVLQSSLLRPLYSASKFVLIGDPDQLPPLVKSNKARALGMDQSLFERLDSENNTVTLTSQYRMNRRIMSLANKVTYKGQLTIDIDDIGNATLDIPNKSVLNSRPKWVRSALSTDLSESVVVLDTGDKYDILNERLGLENSKLLAEKKCSNLCEAGVITHLVATLVEAGVLTEKIGVIAPYKDQVNLLRNVVVQEVEVNTVDQYQGRDKEIILYSGTRSIFSKNNPENEFNILDDHRRLTVAITRAKHKLIIVGDMESLKKFLPFDKLFEHIKSENVIALREGNDDFTWNELLSALKC